MSYLGCLLLLCFGVAIGFGWHSDPTACTAVALKAYYHWYRHYC